MSELKTSRIIGLAKNDEKHRPHTWWVVFNDDWLVNGLIKEIETGRVYAPQDVRKVGFQTHILLHDDEVNDLRLRSDYCLAMTVDVEFHYKAGYPMAYIEKFDPTAMDVVYKYR